jgi:hypothetical protein
MSRQELTNTQALGDCLAQAQRTGTPTASAAWAATLVDSDAAYAVQEQVAASMGWFDATPARYWKSGGGSRQTPLSHAALPPSGVRNSPADFSDLALHLPGIEAEIALRLGCDVSAEQAATLSHQDAIKLIDALTVSVEVVASRWIEGGAAPALLRLADLQSHGALALGAWQSFTGFAAQDWSRQRCKVRVGAQPASEHVGSHPLADPTWVLPAWLRHLTRHGAKASAGTVVTTGTWCGLLPVQRGDQVEVSFDGIGAVALRL